MTAIEAVRAWRRFANNLRFEYKGSRRSWAEQISQAGYVDEETLVQPTVFPKFADEFLDFKVNDNLAFNQREQSGKPDFTPVDAVTHPFVFETKSSSAGVAIEGFNEQVERYLVNGRPRIRRVVLTNLVGLRVFELNEAGRVSQSLEINLKGLLLGADEMAAGTGDAKRLAAFFQDFRYRKLSRKEKLERIREAPEWNPLLEVTEPIWLSRRLDEAVQIFGADVELQIAHGALTSPLVSGEERAGITGELRELEWRIGGDWSTAHGHNLADYLAGKSDSSLGKALQQYKSHVAYYAATRILFVRIWEDLGLLPSMLHDGGFDHWMSLLQDTIRTVVEHSFLEAKDRYPALFSQRNNYTWFTPSPDSLVDAIYELANTYFGAIEDDILGTVYERLLERVDRQLLGQYYTPRDVIRLIWDLLSVDRVIAQAESDDRELRVLDIATGSGGFLVEAARRLRTRLEDQTKLGAGIRVQEWVDRIAIGLIGAEIQRFPAYLAELNLLIQLGLFVSKSPGIKIPPLGILCTDTLSLHNPVRLFEERGETGGSVIEDVSREDRERRVKDPSEDNRWFDLCCGNPPYVGEKKAAGILQRTRERFPYWEQYIGPHLDYLYWFLILGVSKLRNGGRFGFITTEYWLRADGARALRKYLADRCHVESILVFRDLRLFPDAPGQHSMVIVGERVAKPDPDLATDPATPQAAFPRVSIYAGRSPRQPERQRIFEVLRDGKSQANVVSFRGSVSPNVLKGESWGELLLTKDQFRKRERLRNFPQRVELALEEGVISGADRLRSADAELLPPANLRAVGWPARKAGIFVLEPKEVAQLGSLNAEERSLLRKIVNTKDVYPYAAVLPDDASSLIYLPPPGDRHAIGDVARVQQIGFPKGFPALERHLEPFRPILQNKVEGWRERRPWWSLHRARPGIAAHEGTGKSWANYAVTTRWGAGGRLLVGLAPRNSVPSSALHTILPQSPANAAYVAGLLNSSLLQELSDTLPPGELRQGDLLSLGLPIIGTVVPLIESAALELANLVRMFVTDLGRRWPLLPPTLREQISLDQVPIEAWLPRTGPRASWGEMLKVNWVGSREKDGSQTAPIVDVTIERDLFGPSIRATGASGEYVRIQLKNDSDALLNALRAYGLGISASGGTLGTIGSAVVPTDPNRLIELYETDLTALQSAVSSYRSGRKQIDDALESAFQNLNSP